MKTSLQIRNDLLAIWHAGLDGVRVDRLIRRAVTLNGNRLQIGGKTYSLDSIDRIVVIGGGKASGAMAKTLESIFTPIFATKKIGGWINVPADGGKPLQKIHLHPARPMGVNEPTPEAVAGTLEILNLADSLTEKDLCICLISGGGSALLVAPANGITLDEKIAVTRRMSAAGATIQELNAVRKTMSQIKGGKLAERCRGKKLAGLILSDVLGDPLDVIASGPTIEKESDPNHAHFIVGNLSMAVKAATEEAIKRGYKAVTETAIEPEGTAEEVGVRLLTEGLKMEENVCLISGGEPVVKLVSADQRGLGGRNQQLVLAALTEYCYRNSDVRLGFLSGGTDGEDGPTDAAGAWFDPLFMEQLQDRSEMPESFLRRNDAYHFFEPLETLLKTGATGTNVCDLRIVLR